LQRSATPEVPAYRIRLREGAFPSDMTGTGPGTLSFSSPGAGMASMGVLRDVNRASYLSFHSAAAIFCFLFCLPIV